MIFQGTYLRVIDNSGARRALCLKVLKKKQKSRGFVGEKIVVAIKQAIPHYRIKRRTIQQALIVRDGFQRRRFDGTYLRFTSACCIILKKDGSPVGNKISGAVPMELRLLGHIRLLSIATIAI
jgi:large subunit ribosomal protein L14